MNKDELLEQIRQGEHILTYGVDAHTSSFDSYDDINHALFFKELYVRNNSTEQGLLNCAERQGVFDLRSVAGAGKTTVLHYAIKTFKERHNLPTCLIDFKVIHFKQDSPSFSKYLHGNAKNSISTWIKSRAFNSDCPPVLQQEYTLRDIAAEIVTNEYAKICSPDSQEIINSLLELINDPSVSLRQHISRASTKGHNNIGELIDLLYELQTKMSLKDLCFGLTTFSRLFSPKSKVHHLLIALDNVDAIPDLRTQGDVNTWLRTERGELEKLASIIYSARTTTDFIEPPTPNFQGRGGFYVSNETFFPPAQSSKAEQVDSGSHGYFDETTSYFLEDGLLDREKGAIAWDLSILTRRINYLDSFKRKDGKPSYSCISNAISEIHKIRHVHVDLSQQAGRNRRFLLGSVISFIEYISKELSIDFESLGKRQDGSQKPISKYDNPGVRGSAIKSLYYKMLGNPKALGGSSFALLPADLIDPIGMVKKLDWSNGNRINPDDLSKIEDFFLNLLLVFSINTLATESVKLKGIYQALSRFGYSKAQVDAAIIRFIQDRHASEKPFFEIEGFHKLLHGEIHPNADLSVVATSRATQVATISIYMFNYVCERIRQEISTPVIPEDVDNLNRGLVDPGIVKLVPLWVSRLLTVELLLLDRFMPPVEATLENPLTAYTRLIVSQNGKFGIRSLISSRIIENAISYLTHHLTLVITKSESPLIQQYVKTLNSLFSLRACIAKIETNISSGGPHGVPRGQAIDPAEYVRIWNLSPERWPVPQK